MVSSRKSRAKVREGKKPFEVSVVVQQRVVVHTAVKIWKTYKLIYVQCLCLKCYKLDIFRNSFKRNKSQSYLRIIAQNFKERRFFKKLIILALFFHLLEHFVSIYIVCVCFLEDRFYIWSSEPNMVSLFWRFFWHQLAAQQLWWWWLKTKLTFHRVAYFNNQKFLYLMKPFLSQKSWQDAASCLLLSTFEVKLITTSFIWFVHWTKNF